MRRIVTVVLVLALVATALASNISAASKPNLIVILTDDQDLGSPQHMPRTLELLNLRDRVPLAWLEQMSQRASALRSCRGETCRQIEAQPLPEPRAE